MLGWYRIALVLVALLMQWGWLADGEGMGEEGEEDLNPFDLPSAGSSDEFDDEDDDSAAERPGGGMANVATLDGMSHCSGPPKKDLVCFA